MSILNPFAEVAKYYVKKYRLRSPIVVETRSDRVALGIRSFRAPAFEVKGLNEKLDRGAVRTLTIFGSSTELSVSHRAPMAYFSDEIRIQRRGVDVSGLPTPRWVGEPLAVLNVGPLRMILNSTKRQASQYAEFSVKSAQKAARHPLPPPNSAWINECVYTMASREIQNGTRQQMDFDPEPR